MAPLSIIGALSALPLAFAHMQMSSPSPLRDPHADRPNEPKDYNILDPLKADGSNFACKGYHLNTPLNAVATYAAGSKQTLRLKGSATHGGGSCQISLSGDGGSSFSVLKSIIGGCPLKDNYDFTIPSDIPPADDYLLAWTWFNRIGNREMYMNCAVVNITNKRTSKRDSQASAAKVLSKYPDLFVANLANINDCKTQEITDVIFDNPGKQVSFGNGDTASMRSTFRKGQCTGKGSKKAGSKDTSSSNSGGQWSPPAQSSPQQGGGRKSGGSVNCNDGFYHPNCWGGSSRTSEKPAQPQQPQQPQQSQAQKSMKESKPNTKVQQELDAYLSTLYARGVARRSVVPASEHAETYSQKKECSALPEAPKEHTHKENCKHKSTGYAPENHHVDSYKRTDRLKRWISYNKRADRTPIRFHRGDEKEAYQSESTEASTQTPTDETAGYQQTYAQASTQAPEERPVQKSWTDMTPDEQFEAFLRRMVELSTNMASLIKYAAASTVNIPYYPPASTYSKAEAPATENTQAEAVANKRAKRGVLASTYAPLPQVYPGPSIGSISASGDATDADDGFKAWFPNLVQGLMKKRQLVDPVTSEASKDAGDSVNVFDALFAQLFKAFDDLLNTFGDKPETDPVPASAPESDPLPIEDPLSGIGLNFPDDINAQPFDNPPSSSFLELDIPDLGPHYFFPPQLLAPEYPKPQLKPGYVEGPDGPVWVGEGPEPDWSSEWSSDEPSITITIEPVDVDGLDPTPTGTTDPAEIFPGESVATSICVEPIPQIGFNSCLGGCSHTADEIAAHDVYLQNFAAEQAAYEVCLQSQALEHMFHHGISQGDFKDPTTSPFEPPDASDRRPRPGQSQPLIPYSLPSDLTNPSNESTDTPSTPAIDTAAELQPYQNKTLGELVTEILNNPDSLGPSPDDAAPALTPVPSNSSDDVPAAEPKNPLQQAADQAEAGVTVPAAPVSIDPAALESIADVLPWLLGPGPVLTSDVPGEEGPADGAAGM